jgi:hypothetical protein
LARVIAAVGAALPAAAGATAASLRRFVSISLALRENSVGNTMALSRATGRPRCLPRSMTAQRTNFENVLIAPESE